jgi:hypothetical protein
MRAILARSRQLVAYAIFAAGNKEARDKLAALNRAAQENAMTIEALDAALIEAHKHLTAAQAAVARDVAAEHRALARTLLKELQDCAGTLDVLIPHPDEAGLYEPGDPPGVSRAAALAGAICIEVSALRIADISFPKYRWELATKADLRKALIDTLYRGWGWTPGGMRAALKPGMRQPPSVSFERIFSELEKRLSASLSDASAKERAA